MAMDDEENCGVTIHLVDKGIDTGAVLYQATISTTKHDNFNTYPVHQIAKAIPLMKTALNDLSENRVNIKKGVDPSGLWYHPTLWEYLRRWILNGVK
jgi:folate-dependent phosphoribosylglycinamide formyltransferase PurN